MATEEHDQHRDYRSGKYTGFNMEWYDKLRASKPNWKKVSEQRVHPNRGIPVHVKAGQVMRSIIPDGSNIIDVWFFEEGIKNTAGEQYDPVITAGLEGFICRKNSRLWSNLPYCRPMATYIDDNIDPELLPDEHHWPVWHGGHCSPELNQAGYNILEHASCHTNALEAILLAGYDWEMAEALACTHNMCIFQPMGVTDQQMDAGHISPTWHNVPSHLKPGTYVDYYAEIDLFLPISHCPYGDQSKPPHEADHYPVDIEIWDTGIQPQERPPWTDWRPAFKARLERLKAKGYTGATGRYYSDD
jgi:uncharacterized protein YcgI (DUF1989 family)